MKSSPAAPGALAGLRVLDIASLYAAPLAATIMADFGADVVKIEPPEGDGFRGSLMWPLVARGKRSLVLDLRSPEGCETLRRLVAKADVLVENFPPEVLEKRGLDWGTLSAINPRLVMLSLSCFGQTGPYAGRPGSGTIGEAFAGLTHLTGERDGPPMLSSVALGDAVGAMNAVMGVMMALYARDHGDGKGQQVDATLYEPVLGIAAHALQFWEKGRPPSRNASKMAGGGGLRNVFATADGRYVAFSASTPRHFAELAQLAGASVDGDPDAAVAGWIGGLPQAEVIAQLVSRRIPITPVNDFETLLGDQHVQARGNLERSQDATLGSVLSATPAPRLCGTPGSVGEINPLLDGGRSAVMREWGLAAD